MIKLYLVRNVGQPERAVQGCSRSKSLGGPGPRPKTSRVMSRLIKMLSKGKEKEEELGESSGENFQIQKTKK